MEKKEKQIETSPLARKVSSVFKTFGFHIQEASKSNIWNFVCFNPDKSKKYAIYCTDEFEKVKALVKVAVKQSIKERIRLVVVTKDHYEPTNELDKSQTDYTITSLNYMEKMDHSMIEALKKEGFDGEKVLDYKNIESGKVIVK